MSERQTHDEHDVWFPKSPPIRSEGTDPTLYTISGEVFVLHTSFRRERQARQEAERERDQLKILNAELKRALDKEFTRGIKHAEEQQLKAAQEDDEHRLVLEDRLAAVTQENNDLKARNEKLERVRAWAVKHYVPTCSCDLCKALAAFGEEPAISAPTPEQLDKAARIAIRLGHTHGAAHDVAVQEIANALAEEADDVPDDQIHES